MLLFLDIDGVMVPAKSWKNPELLNDGFPAFSSKASNALQHLISENPPLCLPLRIRQILVLKNGKVFSEIEAYILIK
jgi:hypothetical protein